MILESAIGAVIGGIARLTPEVLNFLDKKNLRTHEIAMGDQQFRLAKLQVDSQQSIKQLEMEQVEFTTAMASLQASIQSQARPTGIAWVDAISALIRPALTVFIFGLYSIVKLAALAAALEVQETTAAAIISIWGPEDASLLAAVVMFWFVGRVWDRPGSKLP